MMFIQVLVFIFIFMHYNIIHNLVYILFVWFFASILIKKNLSISDSILWCSPRWCPKIYNYGISVLYLHQQRILSSALAGFTFSVMTIQYVQLNSSFSLSSPTNKNLLWWYIKVLNNQGMKGHQKIEVV